MTENIVEIVCQNGAADAGIVPEFICAVFPYGVSQERGNVSVYARGYDYHVWVKDSLESSCKALRLAYPEHSFEPFVDISPYDEVLTSARAGLGVIGKNHLLITPRFGSFVFIGMIKTSMQAGKEQEPRGCIGCDKCVKSCPTGVLGRDVFEHAMCLSDITQKRTELNDSEIQMLKNSGYIWGCDVCQLVCPMNSVIKDKKYTKSIINSLSLSDIDGLSDRQFRKKYAGFAFTFRGIKPIKRNLQIIEKSESR